MGQKAQQNPSTPFSRSAVSLSRFVPEEPKPLSPPTPPHPLPVPLQRRRLSQGWSRTGTKLLCPVAGASSEWLMVPLMDECGKTRKEEIDIDAMAAASDSPILDVILSNGAKASMPVNNSMVLKRIYSYSYEGKTHTDLLLEPRFQLVLSLKPGT
ncbi:uncharacterized protein [Lolium perenne]|uniref:uncharacterized protein n=1 Tax=Lolium perenne TaxID=4522 RepID=UPI003A99752E